MPDPGRIRAAIAERIDIPDGVLAVSDGWPAEPDDAILSVQVELGRAVIGPAVLPGVPGCRTCLATRRAGADLAWAAERARLFDGYAERLAGESALLTEFAVHTIAGIAAAELDALRHGRSPRTAGAVIVVDLERLTTEMHPFLPDPRCPVCSPLPDDEPAPLELRSRPKPSRETLRVTSLAGRDEHLRATYVDSFAGVVGEVRETDAGGLPVSYAPTGWPERGRTEIGIGRAADRVTSGLAAILEAVERRAGTHPSARRPSVRGSYAELAEHAVDPRDLGLLPEDNGLGYPRFHPDLELEWVWGYSFGRSAPVLVPRTYAFYGHTLTGDAEHPLVYETSNGCALGGCLEEAVLHGLLEVAERDAFLLTWYARMPAPRVALASARSVELRLLAERVERVHGYRVLVFDTTVEHGIPSVALLAVDRTPAPDRPAVLCASAAHLDPEQACLAALGELALLVAHQVREYPGRGELASALVADGDLVREMDHHALLYGHADTVPRWDFLLGGEAERAFDEAFLDRPEPAGDLRDDLLEIVGRYRKAGLDVIVVDQTGPEQRAANLAVVKAIVPGTLPITFGQRNRRVHGLPRLHTVPMLLGHRSTPLPAEEINPHPHPFP
jgi:ribosomal protein S12 methylthiotransferase accessory factor